MLTIESMGGPSKRAEGAGEIGAAEEVSELSRRRREKATRTPMSERVVFPSSSSRENEDEEWALSHPSLDASPSTIGRAEGRRVISQTTTVRKTERRQVRISLPEFDNLFDTDDLSHPSSSRSHRYSTTSTSSTSTTTQTLPSRSSAYSSFRASRPNSPSGVGKVRRSTSQTRSTRSSLPPRRTSSSTREASPAGAGAAATWSGRSPSSRSSGPSASSPFFHRSLGGGGGTTSDGRRLPSSSSATDSVDINDPFAFANAVSESTMPYVTPVVSAFTFLAVSAVAALTISAVLFASFSLTFYDDCTSRVGSVRAGMGRLIGNAREVLDLAVRATAEVYGTDSAGRSGSGRAGGGRRPPRPTTIDEEEDDEAATARRSRSHSNSAPSTPTPSSSGTTTPRSNGHHHPPFGPFSPVRPFTSTSLPPHHATAAAGHQEPDLDRDPEAGWNTDDDALPYDVPHSTPYASRPSSPHRRSRTSTSSTSASSPDASTKKPTLPPRPPLAVLIPSVVFALLFTIAKVLAGALTSRASGGGGGGSGGGGGGGGRRRKGGA